MLVRMLCHVGECRSGQYVRVPQSVANVWIAEGKAIPAAMSDNVSASDILAAHDTPPVTMQGTKMTTRIQRKRRR